MKIFIVFFAFLHIHVSYMLFQGDMDRYIEGQATLKALAEECAAGAALYYDYEAYADGEMVFNYEEGRKCIEYILDKGKGNIKLIPDELSYQVDFEDDLQGYGNGDSIPAVTVDLHLKTQDVFRLPFIRMEEIKRSAKYELPKE